MQWHCCCFVVVIVSVRRHGWHTGIICLDPLRWCNLNCVLLLCVPSLWSDTAFHRMNQKQNKKRLNMRIFQELGGKWSCNFWTVEPKCLICTTHFSLKYAHFHFNGSSHTFASVPFSVRVPPFEASFSIVLDHCITKHARTQFQTQPYSKQNSKCQNWYNGRYGRERIEIICWGKIDLKEVLTLELLTEYAERRVIEHQRTYTHEQTRIWFASDMNVTSPGSKQETIKQNFSNQTKYCESKLTAMSKLGHISIIFIGCYFIT